ncbi:MAG: M20/M25/M40 family metallo-hydrolase [bacterium]|nr:M20/M25/M40 family metallo-hydrolase [bacterium]
MSSELDVSIYQRPEELLQHLIRFNTGNPPGNEKACIDYIDALLKASGIETRQFAKAPDRPNLVARIDGKGDAAPLLLYGHVDVVNADNEGWKHPPFEGVAADGFVWGRGALDMKGPLAMMISAFIKAKKEKVPLAGDVILCIVSDEEELGEYGAAFLVERHPELFKDVRYALGEFGGFTLHVCGKRFYPIEIAQKQKCCIKAIIKGESGHGSSHFRGGAMAKTARMLDILDKKSLPPHITIAAEKMMEAMAEILPFPSGMIMRQLLKPGRTDFILKLLGEKGNVFVPMFHNTVNATIVRGGDKINVIPDTIEVQFDVRLLPGYRPEDVIGELEALVGGDIRFECFHYDEGPAEPDMAMVGVLADIIQNADPGGYPVPLLLTGSTDARFFSRLGIQTYGFVPMQLPEEMNFNRTIHSVNERIPVESLTFGSDAIYKALQKFPG